MNKYIIMLVVFLSISCAYPVVIEGGVSLNYGNVTFEFVENTTLDSNFTVYSEGFILIKDNATNISIVPTSGTITGYITFYNETQQNFSMFGTDNEVTFKGDINGIPSYLFYQQYLYGNNQTITIDSSNSTFFTTTGGVLSAYSYSVLDGEALVPFTVTDNTTGISYNSNINPLNLNVLAGDSNYTGETAEGREPITFNLTMTSGLHYNYSFNFSPIYNLTFIDERTLEPFNMSNYDEFLITLFCTDDVIYQEELPINNSNQINLTVPCEYNKIKFSLTYDDITYYRTLKFTGTDIDYPVYLLDLYNDTTQYVYISLTEYDLFGLYEDIAIRYYRIIGNETVQITGDFVDVGNRVPAYLLFAAEYIIYVESSNQPTVVMGTFAADTSNTDQILRLFNINIGSESTSFSKDVVSSTYIANTSNVKLYSTYNDSAAETNYTTIAIYNGSSSGALIYTATSTGSETVYIYPAAGNLPQGTYYVLTTVESEVYGTQTIEKIVQFGTILQPFVSPFESEKTLSWVVWSGAVVIGLTFTAASASIGLIVVTLFLLVVSAIGNFIPITGIGVVLSVGAFSVIALLAIITFLRRGR